MPKVIVTQYGINIETFPEAILHTQGGHFQSCRWNDNEKTAVRNENIKYREQEILVFSDVDGFTEFF